MDEERKSQIDAENQLLQAAASILAGMMAHETTGISLGKDDCRRAMKAAIELSYLAAQNIEEGTGPDDWDSTYDPQ